MRRRPVLCWKRQNCSAQNGLILVLYQPFENYPDLIKHAARRNGATAQVAGGVPAMCDGVTQGQDGMELSLLPTLLRTPPRLHCPMICLTPPFIWVSVIRSCRAL